MPHAPRPTYELVDALQNHSHRAACAFLTLCKELSDTREKVDTTTYRNELCGLCESFGIPTTRFVAE